MLFNVKINAGQSTEIAKQGRHINMVLAAGEINVRAMTAEGQVTETKVIAGMSFSYQSDYSRVAFSSDVSQQIKVWIAMFPLTYAPDSTREVGSAAVSSTYKEAYSGTPQILLEAETGRNQVTISPSVDILVGGVGLTIKNGIPVQAGQAFTLKTQGAIYGLETSGAYPPTVSTEAAFSDFAAPTIVPKLNTRKMVVSNAINNEYWLNNNGATIDRYNADNHELSGSFTAQGATMLCVRRYDIGDYFEWGRTHNIGLAARWIRVHKTTLAVTTTDIGFGEAAYTAYHNGVRMVLNRASGEIYLSNDGVTWGVSGVPCPYPTPAQVKGIDFDSANNIYVITSSNLYKSVDDGATWTSVVLVYPLDTESGWSLMAINKNNDAIYYVSDFANHSLVYSVDGGVTFINTGIQSGSGGSGVSANYVDFFGDTLFISGATKMYQYNESIGLATYDREEGSQIHSIWPGDDGRIYWSSTPNLYVVQGELVQSGGVPVAIMSEVN